MELNDYIITKMGWKSYHPFHGLPIKLTFKDDNKIKFFILDKERKTCFVIKQTIDKQIAKNTYNFVIVENCFDKIQPSKLKVIKFSSNLELLNIIKEYEACNEDYQRHFKINKLLK